MKVTKTGNTKLGKCFVVSRPVGDTCPIEGSANPCAFFNNGCYAEKTEKMYPTARPAGMQNLITEKNRIRAMILDAIKSLLPIRWHERGDWFKDNVLDTEYVDNVTWACESILAEGLDLPDMWFYTHIYDNRLVKMGGYMSVYASVHNADDKALAVATGFKLFAWCDSDNKIAPKRPRHKAQADAWRASLPKLVIIDNDKYVTCPEIRRGRGVVTCAQTEGSVACKMCILGLANVLFHSH